MLISTIDILDRAKGSDSDYAIYKKLKLSAPSVVSTWRKRGHVSAYYAAKLAEIAGLDPMQAAAIATAEGESDPEKRAYLLQLANERYNSTPHHVGSLAQLVEQRTLNP